jgi:outer membrane protein TolC
MRTAILKIAWVILDILAQCAVVTAEPNNVILPAIVKPNRFLTLEDYLSYAEAHNAGLKISYQQWATATEQATQAKSLPEPQFTQGEYAQLTDMYERQAVIIMQMFPWFGKISARAETAVKNAEAAKQKYQAARLSLLREVKRDFYEYAYLTEAIATAGENLDLMKRFEKIAMSMRPATEISPPDVVRARAKTEKLENVSKGLERLCEPTVSRLKAALNLPAEMNLPTPEHKDFKPAAIDYELLVNLLKQKNPELAGLGFEAMAAKSRVKLAEKNIYPDIGIGLQFEQMKRPGSNTQDSSRDAMLFLSLNLPLWQNDYRGEQRRAVAEATSIEQQIIEAENSILTKASQAYYEYNDSINRIGLYRETLIPKAEEQLGQSEAAYREGNADFISLLDAQQTLMDYRLAYQRVLADNRQKLAELEMLAGADLDKQQ